MGIILLLSGEKRRRRDRPQTGVLTPGTSALTKLSPERATEHITCLISNCLYLCRPFGTFHVVAQLPGVLRFAQAQAESTPVCALSSLRDFRVSPHELLLSRKPNYRRINRGALDFPRTAIKLYRMVWQVLLSAEEGLYAGTHRRQDSLSTYTKAAEHLYKGG